VLVGAAVFALGCIASPRGDERSSSPTAIVQPSPTAAAAEPTTQLAQPEQGFRYPSFELEGHLRDVFEVSHCEYISGMTCKIRYNGARPLPSKVFFTEFDAAGHPAGPAVRLIYPRLNPGETGSATFRIRMSSATKVLLQAEWRGPWQNPY